MEAGQISLDQLFKNKQENWDFERIFSIFRDLRRKIKKLHLLSIYHCDLKGCNIVYDYYGKIKFIDFGSIVFDSNKYGKYGYT